MKEGQKFLLRLRVARHTDPMSMEAKSPFKRPSHFLSLATAMVVLGTGLTMPSCPGTQGLQQQIDTMAQSSQLHDKQIKVLSEEIVQTKNVVIQLNGVAQTQKEQIDRLEIQLRTLTERPASASRTAPRSSSSPQRPARSSKPAPRRR